jgi:hypothetical protein
MDRHIAGGKKITEVTLVSGDNNELAVTNFPLRHNANVNYLRQIIL